MKRQKRFILGLALLISHIGGRALAIEPQCITAFIVTVDPNQPLGALAELGKYGMVDEEIIHQNWLASPGKPYEAALELISFPNAMTTEEVLIALDRRGLLPANRVELLSVGALEPKLRTDSPIIALGTILGKGGQMSVSGIYWQGNRRRLERFEAKVTWPAKTNFLAAYKQIDDKKK